MRINVLPLRARDKTSHPTAFFEWDSSPHLQVQLMILLLAKMHPMQWVNKFFSCSWGCGSLNCTHYTAYITLHTLHCTHYTAHITLHRSHYTYYTAYITLHILHCIHYTTHYTAYITLHILHYTLHCIHYTAHITLHTLNYTHYSGYFVGQNFYRTPIHFITKNLCVKFLQLTCFQNVFSHSPSVNKIGS